ncbi:hypothetical protein ACFSTH_13225 [Paenibacillus yanchengensis]|uniref:Uncharacterized protein n=1 Tax=Paenibacillus yanchengensis TaxID=2035833 RepID=A0ABW4YNJ0_9BACL
MQYSIRGHIQSVNTNDIISVINQYQLWRLVTQSKVDDTFSFEVWVGNLQDKSALFNDFKRIVDSYGGWVDWHECDHHSGVTGPCVVQESYSVGDHFD